MKIRITFLFIVLLLQMGVAQPPPDLLKYSLAEIVAMAREQSPAALQVATVKENRYWQWRTYKANYKPQLTLDGTLPDFSKTNQPVVQREGNIEFWPVYNDNSSVQMNISQNISLTGGQLFAGSYLQRFTDFNQHKTQYNGNPVLIGFSQPLFAFNPLRWDRKIEPLRYEESKKKYVEDLENISRDATSLFFELLLAQINLDIARKNRENSDTIYTIGEVRYTLGRLPRNELLQLKLTVLNARKAVAQAQLRMETATLALKSFVGITGPNSIELALPEQIPAFRVDEQTAIREARRNRQKAVEFRRLLLEAQRDVAKAKGDNGLNANLIGTFGLKNKAAFIPDIYQHPKDQQTLRIGFGIPIMDWGRSASRIKTAQANQKYMQYLVAQEEINFEQEIYTQAKLVNMLREQVDLNREADQTGLERYEISKNRYRVGDLGVTDLNIAQQEKDQARRDYILTLKGFWDAYYAIRSLTLYDFEQNKAITEETM